MEQLTDTKHIYSPDPQINILGGPNLYVFTATIDGMADHDYIVEYRWDFGDRTPRFGNPFTFNYPFNNARNVIELNVMSANGLQGHCFRAINNQAVYFEPTPGLASPLLLFPYR